MLREASSSIINETLRVYKIDLSTGLLARHSLKGKEAHQLRGYTNACGACTEKKYAMVCKRTARGGGGEFCRVDEPAENYGTSALDIIVENRVFSSVSIEILESVGC